MVVRSLVLSFVLFCAVAGCAPSVDDPYNTCEPGDACTQGTTCLGTTLPASAGYSGYLCTMTCHADSDCPQDITNFPAICVEQQCYIQCPDGGAHCPYGTTCLSFQDASGTFNLCTP